MDDGGHQHWEILVSGFSPSNELVKYKFSNWLASVRKGVECFFVILKQRFRSLVNPITLSNQEDVANARGNEKAAYEKLQILLANNLQAMYREEKLRWPKHCSEIDSVQ